MKWLHEKRCPWDEKTFDVAAKHGNLENIKWLYEEECPRSKRFFAHAARHGNLDNIKWLYKKACPLDEDILLAQHLVVNWKTWNGYTIWDVLGINRLSVLQLILVTSTT